MPLVVEGAGKAAAHCELRTIGFWMTVKEPSLFNPCEQRSSRACSASRKRLTATQASHYRRTMRRASQKPTLV
jgi:hypothetical protein